MLPNKRHNSIFFFFFFSFSTYSLKMMMAIVLLAVLFLVGLFKTFFRVPKNNFLTYLLSFLPNMSTTVTNKTTIGPKNEKEKEKKNKSSTTRAHDHEKAKMEQVFATFDKNGDGFITKEELGESLRSIGLFSNDKEVGSMFEKLDSNGDGLIDLDEFRKMYESLGRRRRDDQVMADEDVEDQEESEEELREAFDVFDTDGDGLISVEELCSVLSSLGLKQGMRIDHCKEMIRKVDRDGDGMVNFDEFKEMMKGGERFGTTSS